MNVLNQFSVLKFQKSFNELVFVIDSFSCKGGLTQLSSTVIPFQDL